MIIALAGPISNLATSHSSFVPTNITQATGFDANVNATSKLPGLMPLMQLFPIFFVLIGLLFVARFLNPGSIFEGETESRPYTKADFGGDEVESELKPEHYFPPWNCSNCAGPNPEGHPMCQYCGEAYSPRAVKFS